MAKRTAKQKDDPGTPGSYYFEEPIVVTIPPPKTSVTVITTQSSGTDTLSRIGRVRLESSHRLHGYTPPDDVTYELGNWPTGNDIALYLKHFRAMGFDEGAIVTRRYQQPGRWKFTHQWGLIICTHKEVNTARPYRPFSVRWFDNMNNIETACAEDLCVIHQAMPEQYVADILEEQGMVL